MFPICENVLSHTLTMCSSLYVYYASKWSSRNICIKENFKKIRMESIGESFHLIFCPLPSYSSLTAGEEGGAISNHSLGGPSFPVSESCSDPSVLTARPERKRQQFSFCLARPSWPLCRPMGSPGLSWREEVGSLSGHSPNHILWSSAASEEVLFWPPIPMLASISQLIPKMEREEAWLIISP